MTTTRPRDPDVGDAAAARAERTRERAGPGTRAAAWGRMAACALALLTTACDPLAVDAPTVTLPEDLANAAGAEAMRVAAIRSFGYASSNQARASGLLTDELTMGSSTQSGPERFLDRRLSEEAEPEIARRHAPYARLQTARLDAQRAVRQLRAHAPERPSATAFMFALSGFTNLIFAEEYCPGLALNEVTADYQLVYTPALTTDEVFAYALADMDSALAYAADSVHILNLARVGRARALLGLGRFPDAASAAAAVPTDFSFDVVHTTEVSVQRNQLYLGTSRLRYTVADREGGTGLDFASAEDPRVATTPRGKAFDGTTDAFSIDKYPDASAPVVLASGIEARLIEAEAALRAGDAPDWLSILNTLRAAAITPGLPALADPGSEAARVDLHFRERAFWLFATSHRLGDLRRLVRHYGRTAAEVFPTGEHHHGGPYGNATSIPFPAVEEGLNPYVSGCTVR